MKEIEEQINEIKWKTINEGFKRNNKWKNLNINKWRNTLVLTTSTPAVCIHNMNENQKVYLK